MTRLHTFSIAIAVALSLAGCKKPSDESCRKAINNMRHLMGTENIRDDKGIEGEVRRCKGGSTKKAVECAINATTLDELRHCEFFKVPENAKGIGDSPDTGAAGSAAMGTGSAMGSGAGSAMGSGTGSAMGSAMGSGAGSAMGSGAGSAMGSAAGSAATGSAASGSAAAGAGAAGGTMPAGSPMTGSAAGSAAH